MTSTQKEIPNNTISNETRIIQRNVIFITGIPSILCNEKELISSEWFGQFGNIHRICIEQTRKDEKLCPNAYIQYNNEMDAAKAMQRMHLYQIPETNNILKVNYAVNRFCKYFLNGINCVDKQCPHIHYNVDPKDIVLQTQIDEYFNNNMDDHDNDINQLQKENDGLRKRLEIQREEHKSELIKLQRIHDIECMIYNDEIEELKQYQMKSYKNEKQFDEFPQNVIENDDMDNLHKYEYNAILEQLEELRIENDRIRRKHCALIRDYNILQQKCNNKMDEKSECIKLRQIINSMVYQQEILNERLMNEMNEYNILKNECFWLKQQLKSAQKSETELKELMFNECDYGDSNGVLNEKLNEYKSWDWLDVYEWINTVRDNRFSIYNEGLSISLKQENINGIILSKMNENDLFRIGITNYHDQILLLEDIQQLIYGYAYNHHHEMEGEILLDNTLDHTFEMIEGGIYI